MGLLFITDLNTLLFVANKKNKSTATVNLRIIRAKEKCYCRTQTLDVHIF